jgi:prepilin-type N-terminal cleavage/methylation domain-containing protein/prepilin-type processing-associated H-X9-DG protein
MKLNRAFTLIELLVVIAIIAILAAILFPVFAQAKLAAKKTASISNLKQASLGIIMYNGDVDDKYDAGCGGCWFYPLDGGWSWDTQPYMKSLPVLRDPTDSQSKRNWPTWAFPPNNPTVSISYVSNGYIWQDSGNGYATYIGGVMGVEQGPEEAGNRCGAGPWMTRSITTGSAVNAPASTIMLSTRAGSFDLWGMGDVISGVTWWDNGSGGAGLIPNAHNSGAAYTAKDASGNSYIVNANNRWGAVYTPYSNQSPFAFCDGHVKSMEPGQTDPNPTNTYVNGPSYSLFPGGHDPQNMWDAYR